MVTVNNNFSPNYFKPYSFPAANNISPLEAAIELNDIVKVKSLLEDNSPSTDLFLRSGAGGPPLILAAVNMGYNEIVDLLIASKHQLPGDEREKSWREALTLAAQGGNAEVVHSLCLALGGFDQRGVMGSTALLSAVQGGHLLLVNALLFYGADINTKNISSGTPLTSAVYKQDLDVVHALLAHEARNGDSGRRLDLNAAGLGGLTAMELAVIMRAAAQKEAAEIARLKKLEELEGLAKLEGGDGLDEDDGLEEDDGLVESTKTRIANEIVEVLRLSGANEVEKDVDEIFGLVFLWSREAPDAATSLLLDELKEPHVAIRASGHRNNLPLEQKIRIENYTSFLLQQRNQFDKLERELRLP